MTSLIKHSGQVFTPDYLVSLILAEVGYYGADILQKHCGDGALCDIVSRYIKAYIESNQDIEKLPFEIHEYIHGIELAPWCITTGLKIFRQSALLSVSSVSTLKHKSGGCYTYNSKDLETFLNYENS